MFPEMVCQMISVGEATGALDVMLNKVAGFYEDEVDQAVENLTSMMEPLIIVGLGIVLGSVIIALTCTIFSMASGIGKGEPGADRRRGRRRLGRAGPQAGRDLHPRPAPAGAGVAGARIDDGGEPPERVRGLSGQFRLAAVLFLAMGVSAALLPRLEDHPLFAWSQLGIDTVFATALVSFTGGPVSPFFPLYFLNIVAAAWLLPPRGPLAVAGFDALAFVGILALRGVPWVRDLFDGSPLLMYSQITLQIFAFSLVGILSGLLSSNVRKAKAALAVQVRETQQLQARHDLVLDGIETGVLLISPEGTIASANASAQRVLGECAGEPLGAVLRSDQRRWAQTVVPMTRRCGSSAAG